MYCGEISLRFRGQDCAGHEPPGPIISRQGWVPPELVQSREGERAAVGPGDELRNLLPARGTRRGSEPLVEPVGRDEAPAFRECGCERGFVQCRFETRVDQPCSELGTLGPARNE